MASTRHGRNHSATGILFATAFALSVAPGCRTTEGGSLVRTSDGFRLTESGSVGLGDRAHFREATASLESNALDLAIEALEEAVEASPERAAPRVNLAIALRRADRLAEAEEVLREAIRVHPRHVVAHNELGIVYRRLGRLEASRTSYERALPLHGDFHFAHRNLAILCDLFLDDVACALTHYRRTLEIVPDDSEVAMWIEDLEQRHER